jgi:hypothetical protein
MATITISSDFFENEIRNYSNWEQAFWRELFQNSIDAGANKIDISYELINNHCIVSFRDNGKGMDKNILENVFFNLGTTTKNSSNSVGGFGRARIILCFAQTDYQIYTNNLSVTGSGATYEIEEDINFLAGCKFVITIPLNKFYSNFEKFELALKRYLLMSNIRANININNNKYDYQPLIARGKKKELSFGTAYANKSAEDKNKIIFRVNGVAMFSRYTSANIQVIVEINPEKSRQVLLSNRDSLIWSSQDEVDQFCELISKETLSAFREKNSGEEIIIGSARKFQRKIDILNLSPKAEGNEFIFNRETPFQEESFNKISSITAKSSITEGLVVLTKTADKKIRAAARNFSPDKLEAPESRKLKLLKQWAIACEAALESLCKLRDINEIDWRPGFVFDETMEACHKLSNDGAHTLMLNPIHINGNDIGKIKFSITNFNSHVELLTLAAHEVAHCEHKWHDESYAGLFTDIISDMMKNINILSKEMKAA